MVKELQDEAKVAVVLSEYQVDKLVTVELDATLARGLEEGSYYKFTFNTYQAYIDTDIEHIFRENEVVSVQKTDKMGEEQIREDSCSMFY